MSLSYSLNCWPHSIYNNDPLRTERNDKSNVQYLIEGNCNWKPGHRLKYMKRFTIKQTTIIFQARTIMTKVKKQLRKRPIKSTEIQKHIPEEFIYLFQSIDTRQHIEKGCFLQ